MHNYMRTPIYRDAPQDPWELPDHPPAAFIEIGEAHPDLSGEEIAVRCWSIVGEWLLWGALYGASATPDERQKIIKAIMLLETDGALGLFNHNYREFRQYKALEFWCNSMDSEELARHCERVLNEAVQDGDKLLKFIVSLEKRRKHGPTPGTTGYIEADTALFPKIDALKLTVVRSAWAACRKLADDGEVAGLPPTAPVNKARRLFTAYQKARSNNSM